MFMKAGESMLYTLKKSQHMRTCMSCTHAHRELNNCVLACLAHMHTGLQELGSKKLWNRGIRGAGLMGGIVNGIGFCHKQHSSTAMFASRRWPSSHRLELMSSQPLQG
eukprot:scaffold112236_cov21-Tisochrysis_lutea.AAC.2